MATRSLHALLAPIAAAPPARTVIFTGPSLAIAEARRRLPGAEVQPPIRRGDLPRAIADGFTVVGIIDGTYVTERTVSAHEILDALAAGAAVYGAASLGALRAVELRGAGMVGVGVIHDWYLRGVTIRDDEVVVGMDPDSFAARNDPLVNLRHACMRAQRAGLLDAAAAGRLLARYAGYHFADRSFARLLREAAAAGDAPAGTLRGFGAFVAANREELDLKRRDALALLHHIADAHHVGA